MKKMFGRRFSPDVRDQGFLMRRRLPVVGTVMPSRKTWAIKPTALDQGRTGTCVGHAWANFLRCAPIQSNAGIDTLRWQIYDAATQIDEWTDNDGDTKREMGTSVRAGAQAVTDMSRLKSFLFAFDLATALEWVLLQGPVVLGVNWYSSMFKPDAKGIVAIKPTDRVEGGHAFLWRGADTRRALAWCCNSWGDDWGLSGNFAISFRDLERLIHENGEACAATEMKLAPKVAVPPVPKEE